MTPIESYAAKLKRLVNSGSIGAAEADKLLRAAKARRAQDDANRAKYSGPVNAAPSPRALPADFPNLVDAYMEKNQCKRTDAVRAIARSHPKAHARHLAVEHERRWADHGKRRK